MAKASPMMTLHYRNGREAYIDPGDLDGEPYANPDGSTWVATTWGGANVAETPAEVVAEYLRVTQVDRHA